MFGLDEFVLKEKFELLKGNLEEWHSNHGKNIEWILKEVNEILMIFDKKEEVDALSDSEREEICYVAAQVIFLFRLICSVQFQKALVL